MDLRRVGEEEGEARQDCIGSGDSLVGDGSTLMLTGADSPWNQAAILVGLGLRAGRSSLLFVGFKLGRKADHLSLSLAGERYGEPGGEKSNLMPEEFENTELGRVTGGGIAGLDSTWMCVVISGGRWGGEVEVSVLACPRRLEITAGVK